MQKIKQCSNCRHSSNCNMCKHPKYLAGNCLPGYCDYFQLWEAKNDKQN
jgi:hypothetical protein